MQKTSCLRRHHRCDELNEFWLRLQFVKFEGRLRPFVKLMKTVSNSSNSSNSLFKLKGGVCNLSYISSDDSDRGTFFDKGTKTYRR